MNSMFCILLYMTYAFCWQACSEVRLCIASGREGKARETPASRHTEHLHISQFGDVWSVLPQGRPHRTGKDRRNTPEDRLQATPAATDSGD